ncbi:FAD synthase-like [Anneissia japonica]|uniref:FAD synthase-like n=1 Tax=Anneissia japonica TaxID=1529436 RepID=UPI0014258539|nr:FAD synthase-like [Anneissia japonica]
MFRTVAYRLRVLRRHLSTVSRSIQLRAMSSNDKPTAGIIIIGDEILKGHVQDTNSHYLCNELFQMGIKVEKITVVGDDLHSVANEIASFSSQYTHVLTSGGIGPTHDDITFKSVAMAFDESLELNDELVALCKQFFGAEHSLDSPQMKMAFV